MAATSDARRPATRSILAALAVAAVAAAFGTAIFRGPDAVPPALPLMAEGPVLLPDGRTLHVQKFEVSVAEWNACHDAGACTLELRARPGQAPETEPATGLSYTDASEFLEWINGRTGHVFRLPTAAEWAFMARGVLPDEPDPLFTDPALTWASAYLVEGNAPRALRQQGSYSTSPEGIADLDGSVWEWTRDCYTEGDRDRCPAFYVGGEHVAAISYLERDPARGGCAVGTPPAHLGMRLVTDARPPAKAK